MAWPVELGRVTRLVTALQGTRVREHAVLSAVVVFTRSLVHLAGLRFNFVLDWMLLSDPEDLRTDLLRTLYYSHSSPPGFNLLTGVIEKVGGPRAPATAALAFQLFGLVLVNSLYVLCRASGFSSRAAFAVAALFALAPQSFYLERLYHHTCPTAALLALAVGLFHAAVRGQTFWKWFWFFAACAALGWMGAAFHLAWMATMVALRLAFVEK